MQIFFWAGSHCITLEGKVEMESKALMVAITTLRDSNQRCSNIFISSHEFWMVMQGQEEIYNWDNSRRINEIKQQFALLNNT